MLQVSGKSLVALQHRFCSTVPPELTQLEGAPPAPPLPAAPAAPPPPPAQPSPFGTQSLPSQQESVGQLHTFTSWLELGAQPHAPTRHVFGKSPVA